MSLLLLALSVSAPVTVACPDTIRDRQALIASQPGWEVSVNARPRQLVNVAVYQGHPSKRMQVRGDDWSNPEKEVWDTGESIHWVSCHYQNSAIAISFQLPKRHRCVFNKPQAWKDKPSFSCAQVRKSR